MSNPEPVTLIASNTSKSADDFSSVLDVVPEHKTIQILATGKEDASGGRLRQSIGEPDVFFGLGPTRDEKNVDRDSLLGTQGGFSHRRLFGPGIRRIKHVEPLTLAVRCR